MGVQRDWVQKYDVDKSDRGNYAKMPRCHLARGVCAPARQGAELTPSFPFPPFPMHVPVGWFKGHPILGISLRHVI
jgi:hypothetical protein